MTHYPATRFQVRQPAPEYRPRPDWRSLALCALAVAIVLLGALAESFCP